MIAGEQDDVDGIGLHQLVHGGGFERDGGDLEVAPALEGSGEKLGLDGAGIGYEDFHDPGGGGR